MFDRLAKFSVLVLLGVVLHVLTALAAEPLRYELGFEHPSTHLMNVPPRL